MLDSWQALLAAVHNVSLKCYIPSIKQLQLTYCKLRWPCINVSHIPCRVVTDHRLNWSRFILMNLLSSYPWLRVSISASCKTRQPVITLSYLSFFSTTISLNVAECKDEEFAWLCGWLLAYKHVTVSYIIIEASCLQTLHEHHCLLCKYLVTIAH